MRKQDTPYCPCTNDTIKPLKTLYQYGLNSLFIHIAVFVSRHVLIGSSIPKRKYALYDRLLLLGKLPSHRARIVDAYDYGTIEGVIIIFNSTS